MPRYPPLLGSSGESPEAEPTRSRFRGLRSAFIPRLKPHQLAEPAPKSIFSRATAKPLEIEHLNGLYRICFAFVRQRRLLPPATTMASFLGIQNVDLGLPLWNIPQQPDGLPVFPRVPRLPENEPWKEEAFRIAVEWLQIEPSNAAAIVLSANGFSFEDLAEWERILITEFTDLIEKTSHTKAVCTMVRDYELEIDLVEKMLPWARKELASRYMMDADEARSIMVGRLERLYAKAMSIHDTTTALKVLKVQAVVQGLSRGLVENEARDFLSVIRSTAAHQETGQARLPPPTDSEE